MTCVTPWSLRGSSSSRDTGVRLVFTWPLHKSLARFHQTFIRIGDHSRPHRRCEGRWPHCHTSPNLVSHLSFCRVMPDITYTDLSPNENGHWTIYHQVRFQNPPHCQSACCAASHLSTLLSNVGSGTLFTFFKFLSSSSHSCECSHQSCSRHFFFNSIHITRLHIVVVFLHIIIDILLIWLWSLTRSAFVIFTHWCDYCLVYR